MNKKIFKNLFNMLCGKPSAKDLAHCERLTELTGLDWKPVYSMGPDIVFRTKDYANEATVSQQVDELNRNLCAGGNVFEHLEIVTHVKTPSWNGPIDIKDTDHYVSITKTDFSSQKLLTCKPR